MAASSLNCVDENGPNVLPSHSKCHFDDIFRFPRSRAGLGEGVRIRSSIVDCFRPCCKWFFVGRQPWNAGPKLVCVDLQSYTTTPAPDRSDILNVGGFSDAVFEVVASFLAG